MTNTHQNNTTPNKLSYIYMAATLGGPCMQQATAAHACYKPKLSAVGIAC